MKKGRPYLRVASHQWRKLKIKKQYLKENIVNNTTNYDRKINKNSFKAIKLRSYLKDMETGIPIDFHVHSYASKCGGQSVSQIISEATQKSVSNIGIVDHLNTNNVVSIIKRSKNIPFNYENSPLFGIEAECIKYLCKYQIPIALGTDSHKPGGLAHYPWIESLLKRSDLSKIILLVREVKK